MNKTKPTLAQQTYEKVCAIETILKLLEQWQKKRQRSQER